jgi:tetratricopeptide (TPR) repeat protein
MSQAAAAIATPALPPYQLVDPSSLPRKASAKKRQSAEIINFEIESRRFRIEQFTKSITLDPGNPVAYYNRARAYADAKEYFAAIADCNVAIRLRSHARPSPA